MRLFILFALMFSTFAGADTLLPSRAEIVSRALEFSRAHKLMAGQTLFNLQSMPTLQVGATFAFGTIMTLKQFDCAQDRGDEVCTIAAQYCIERNEYPPELNTIYVRLRDASYDVVNVTMDSQDLPNSACD